MKRRTFLLTGLGATGALVLGWGLLPPRQRLTASEPLPLRDGDVPLNGWVAIGTDGVVTAFMPKAEMGQGIHTALAMLLAEELDADWATMRVAHTPIDTIYGNVSVVVDGLPFHPDGVNVLKRTVSWITAKAMREVGIMMTGGSSSVKDCWTPIRLAGATARAQLVATAARTWNVPVDACRTEKGRVIARDGRTLGYATLVSSHAPLARPGTVTLKAPAAYTLVGTPVRRLEGTAKARGRVPFGIDERLPGMLHAAVLHCPVLGGRVARVDDARAKAMRGVRAVVTVPPRLGSTGGVAVIADDTWRAEQALAALDVTWDEGDAARVSSADVERALDTGLAADPDWTYRDLGDAPAAIAGATTILEATYRAPYLAHAPMEPMNCTVLARPEGADVWVGTQVPGIARDAVADVLGLEARQVVIHERFIGGAFGRRLEVDFIAQAAAIAKAVQGTPVQVLWNRAEDTRHDLYRPACAARLRAGLDATDRLVGWHAHSASQAPTVEYARRVFDIGVPGPDKTTTEGSYDVRYEFPAVRVTHARVELPVPVGFWRAVGHSHHAFFTESFVDEVAHAARTDPLAFRRALLARHPRQRAVLDRLATESRWGTPTTPAPDGAPVARGLAFHQSFGTSVAQVAEVSLGPDRVPRVHRVVAVVDCGLAVNPAHIAQQVEGAIVFGLSAALHGAITLDRGRVREGNFDAYRMLRIAEAPRVEVHVMPSLEPPEGLGEPGLPPIAPAVANAVFALTGQRLRTLPLRVAPDPATT